MEAKRCYKCKLVKPLNEFSHCRTRKDGHQYICKECVATFNKENKERKAIHARRYYESDKEKITIIRRVYRRENKEKIAIYHRTYFQSERGKLVHNIHAHKRRMRAKSALSDLTIEQWKRILEAQSGRCNICNKPFNSRRFATMDHIIPLSKGGELTSDNVQALCRSCNSRKNAKSDLQFIQTWSI